ncbi:hypothetical protein H6P81_006915 [Aristolochia fimbriata]|uniref:Bromo domain-containing protein n=1 Tax=Aristolochia fimbriata TaxID=158543 RepID=A0AAV7EZW0_ARIFI|nr:hypothetical protein H6P81_006915 [Aristolochia fimbriata]
MGKIAEPTARKGRKPTKKKGRPPHPESEARRPAADPRRSLRQLSRRQHHYSEYYDDFYELGDEEEEEEEEEEERRREKKLKLVLKVPPKANNHRLPAATDSSDGDDRSKRPVKKRKIDGFNDDDDDIDVEDDECVRSIASGDEKQQGNQGRAREETAGDSASGSPVSGSPSATLLPDAKVLEIILDKLQKKDTYGVYAEPVDPEELPDYHEVIEHPMDFGTVRKKLATGVYSTLEQFEGDVFLICTNAMQYNAPDTIYFRQARAIQELAKKRFEKMKADEPKTAQKTKLTAAIEKPVKKPLTKPVSDHIRSDVSPAVTVAAPSDACTLTNTAAGGGVEKAGNADSLATDKNSHSVENKMDKTEELPAKGFQPKFGRKPLDENRRATYNVSSLPVTRTDSVYSIFESEVKQLVAVGLQSDHSYARSLARFAAVLGPTAWKVASKRIEQALPAGCKFGRGWVGEYEPLPTSVLMLEDRTEKQLACNSKLYTRTEPTKDETGEKSKVTAQHFSQNVRLVLTPCSRSSAEAATQLIVEPSKEVSLRVPALEAKPGLFGTMAMPQQQKIPLTMVPTKPEAAVMKPVEMSCSTSGTSNLVDTSSRRPEQCAEVTSSRLLEMVSRNRNFVPSPFKQPEVNIHANYNASRTGSSSMGLPNGEASSNTGSNRGSRVPLNAVSAHQAVLPSFFAASHQSASHQSASHQSASHQSASHQSASHQSASHQSASHQSTSHQSASHQSASHQSASHQSASHQSASHQSASHQSASHQSASHQSASHQSASHQQQVDDPVKLMRMLSGKMSQGPPQLNSTNPPTVVDSQIMSSVPFLRRDDSSASAAAARAWMSIGPASPFNTTRESHTTISMKPENIFVSPTFAQAPNLASQESRFRNSRSGVFPQNAVPDLSRFHMQSPWQDVLPNSQQKQKKDCLPPDLNIDFQPPASPVRQSSGIRVDSQQPDLALQL